jgi:AmmeMemoRadiSam system protein B
MLPLLVGPGGSTVLADVLDALWGADETRIVVSTDLSHYHDDATAKAIDRETADAIVTRSERLEPWRACGAHAVLGLLEAARRHGLGVRLLDLRTSADTAGDPDRVVGYGAFALS